MRKALERAAVRRFTRLLNRRWFLGRAGSAEDRKTRLMLLDRFQAVADEIYCAHQDREILAMADFLLRDAPAGDMVECGTYRGGGSAKLSWVAEATGRKLYLCDTFEGLPDSADGAFHDAREGSLRDFQGGEFAARLDLVRDNVRAHGRVERCEFVPGLLGDSLPSLEVRPAFVFSDVDLVSSTRDAITHLWPKLRPGGRMFIHDSNFVELVEGMMDPEFWRDKIGEAPPVLWGAGYGLGFGTGALAYLQKPKAEAATAPAAE